MNMILLGAPGAGKGTQAEIVCERLKIPTVSTGNIIREALKSGSEMGKKAKAFVDEGKLVPDEIVIGIVKERIKNEDCKNGFILDGFPRTIHQAEALDEMKVVIDKVIDIEVGDKEILKRMSGRRVCDKCGASYNINSKKPKVEGVCDKCAGTLVQRMDDNSDTVKDRLNVYHSQTQPLKAYYEKQGKLVSVNGEQPLDAITKEIIAEIEA